MSADDDDLFGGKRVTDEEREARAAAVEADAPGADLEEEADAARAALLGGRREGRERAALDDADASGGGAAAAADAALAALAAELDRVRTFLFPWAIGVCFFRSPPRSSYHCKTWPSSNTHTNATQNRTSST